MIKKDVDSNFKFCSCMIDQAKIQYIAIYAPRTSFLSIFIPRDVRKWKVNRIEMKWNGTKKDFFIRTVEK